jgi:hypothetical protein
MQVISQGHAVIQPSARSSSIGALAIGHHYLDATNSAQGNLPDFQLKSPLSLPGCHRAAAA